MPQWIGGLPPLENLLGRWCIPPPIFYECNWSDLEFARGEWIDGRENGD
jgi:hypothetical protein